MTRAFVLSVGDPAPAAHRLGAAAGAVSVVGADAELTYVEGGGSLWRANEPSGMTEIADLEMTTWTPGGGWSHSEGDGVSSIISDATAPHSPSSVGRITYPVGLQSGSNPGRLTRSIPFANCVRVYWCFYFRISANWDGDGSSTNKVIWTYADGQNDQFISMEGSGAEDLILNLRLQNSHPGGRDDHLPNLGPTGEIVRGQWHLIELDMVMNTPGNQDGQFHAWIDGVKTHEYLDAGIIESGDTRQWTAVYWNPYWGGNTGATIQEAQHMDLDHLYISGRTTA